MQHKKSTRLVGLLLAIALIAAVPAQGMLEIECTHWIIIIGCVLLDCWVCDYYFNGEWIASVENCIDRDWCE